MAKIKTRVAKNARNALIVKINIYLNAAFILIKILNLKNSKYI